MPRPSPYLVAAPHAKSSTLLWESSLRSTGTRERPETVAVHEWPLEPLDGSIEAPTEPFPFERLSRETTRSGFALTPLELSAASMAAQGARRQAAASRRRRFSPDDATVPREPWRNVCDDAATQVDIEPLPVSRHPRGNTLSPIVATVVTLARVDRLKAVEESLQASDLDQATTAQPPSPSSTRVERDAVYEHVLCGSRGQPSVSQRPASRQPRSPLQESRAPASQQLASLQPTSLPSSAWHSRLHSRALSELEDLIASPAAPPRRTEIENVLPVPNLSIHPQGAEPKPRSLPSHAWIADSTPGRADADKDDVGSPTVTTAATNATTLGLRPLAFDNAPRCDTPPPRPVPSTDRTPTVDAATSPIEAEISQLAATANPTLFTLSRGSAAHAGSAAPPSGRTASPAPHLRAHQVASVEDAPDPAVLLRASRHQSPASSRVERFYALRDQFFAARDVHRAQRSRAVGAIMPSY
jgi:hypothetical protein